MKVYHLYHITVLQYRVRMVKLVKEYISLPLEIISVTISLSIFISFAYKHKEASLILLNDYYHSIVFFLKLLHSLTLTEQMTRSSQVASLVSNTLLSFTHGLKSTIIFMH